MKITVIGTGYVGLVTGTCLADYGHQVMCVDIDENKINKLKSGKMPFYEPGLKELVLKNFEQERLQFTTSVKEGIQFGKVIFIAVGTPQDKDGSADLKYVRNVAKEIGTYINEYKVIVTKSTVPVGTGMLVKSDILEISPNAEIDIVSNPEFLREGSAIYDFQVPDRIVIGTDSSKALALMKEVYASIERTGRPIIETDIHSAEIIKYAANAMLATRISFMNMLAELCEKNGANVKEVAKGIGLDNRIGPRFLQAGIGYGGSCFPKDVKALENTLIQYNCSADLLKCVDEINQMAKKRFIDKILQNMDVKNKIIGVWGLAFKPKTDDMREAPSIEIIKALLEKGAIIQAFDPEAQEQAKKILPTITYVKKHYDALNNAEALIIMTEWDEFGNIDVAKLKEKMKYIRIFDGRNIYDRKIMKTNNIEYYSVGR